MKKYFVVFLLLLSSFVGFSQGKTQWRLGIDSASGNVHLYIDTIITLPNAAGNYLNGYGLFFKLSDSVRTYFSMTNLTGANSYTSATGVTNIHPAVDTVYRTAGKDSIQFTIDGRYHAILDSAGGGGGGTPAGSTTYIQYNNAGAFGASSTFTYNPSVTGSSSLAIGLNISPSLTQATSGDTLVGAYFNPTFTTVAGARFKSLSASFLAPIMVKSVVDTTGGDAVGIVIYPQDTLNSATIELLQTAKIAGQRWRIRSMTNGYLEFENATNYTGVRTLAFTKGNAVLIGNSPVTQLNSSLLTVGGDETINGGLNINNSMINTNGIGIQISYGGGTGFIDFANRNGGGYTPLLGEFRTSGISISNNTPPDASAMLDIVSGTKGFRKPVMSSTLRDAISSPATMLEISDTTTGTSNFFNGTNWTGDFVSTSAGTLTLKHGVDYTFTGSTSTWTLPAPSTKLLARQNSIIIVNLGSGSITLNSASGSQIIPTASTTTQASLTITSGQSCQLFATGTSFKVLYIN